MQMKLTCNGAKRAPDRDTTNRTMEIDSPFGGGMWSTLVVDGLGLLDKQPRMFIYRAHSSEPLADMSWSQRSSLLIVRYGVSDRDDLFARRRVHVSV
ncbi:hypothetical protein EVAR_29527_1 [Eumeta japonica]|uniref:Uncharacterized protein n=1 Tax=Eumeta variegata TaxID=151549 RepID=A0A4C1WIG4_EUMVA|nr:hypothetical protein EVAR_29527_1 [Eumeta japonica]